MRFTCLLAAMMIGSIFLFTTAPAAETTPPNVVILIVDDLGYGDLSCYGAKDVATPNIDRLVSRGMKLTQFYANCPVCSPTRAALLSGRFCDSAGVPGVIRTHDDNSWGKLRTDIKLLPEVLRPAGYHTAAIGKWHLGLQTPNTPTLRGFDRFWGFLGDMMDDYWNHRRHGINYMKDQEKTIDPEGHATELFTAKAVEWISSYKCEKPLFLYLAYNAPHSPVQPPADWLARYREKHPEVDLKRAKFAAFVEHLDAGIGEVLDALDASPLSENTLILFTSDNGGANYHGACNGPLRGQKQDMLEGGIRVPACAVWPGKIEPGTTSDRVAMTMDLMPTALVAAGVDVPEGLDARSILPTLQGDRQPSEDRYLYWVRLEGGNRYAGKPYYAVRHGDWKLLQNDASESYQLYNIPKDIHEDNDLAAEEPEIAARLRAKLDAHIKECAEILWK